jgi:prevent-host-death family protein
MKTMSSREASQHFGRAERETKNGPVVITERGRPAFVLISHEEYQRLTSDRRNMVDQADASAQSGKPRAEPG